jgi:plasmid stabilization system protein ParE
VTAYNSVVRALAERDFAEAVLWYDSKQLGLGDAFLEAVATSLNDVAANPLRFPIVHRDVRRALLRRFPFAVYFALRGSEVQVIACMHGSRDPKRWQLRADRP